MLYTVDSDVSSLIRAENNLGYLLLVQHEPTAATHHLHRALALCEQHDTPPFLRSFILNSVGELHIALGEPDVAVRHLLASLAQVQGLADRSSEATARHLLGIACFAIGDHDAGDEWFRSAIELLGRLGITERLRACATEYAELLLARGRLEESIAYWRIAANASELSMMKSPVEPAGLTSET